MHACAEATPRTTHAQPATRARPHGQRPGTTTLRPAQSTRSLADPPRRALVIWVAQYDDVPQWPLPHDAVHLHEKGAQSKAAALSAQARHSVFQYSWPRSPSPSRHHARTHKPTPYLRHFAGRAARQQRQRAGPPHLLGLHQAPLHVCVLRVAHCSDRPAHAGPAVVTPTCGSEVT